MRMDGHHSLNLPVNVVQWYLLAEEARATIVRFGNQIPPIGSVGNEPDAPEGTRFTLGRGITEL